MITKELADYVTSQLKEGKSPTDVLATLKSQGGWSQEDLDEVLQFVTHPDPLVSNIKESVGDFSLVVEDFNREQRTKAFLLKNWAFIFLFICLGVGVYFYQAKIAELFNLSPKETTENFLEAQSINQKEEVPAVAGEQKPSLVRLTSLSPGQKVFAGMVTKIIYEVLEDGVNGAIILGECAEFLSGKPKGTYIFDCKIPNRVGPIKAGFVSLDEKSTSLSEGGISLEIVPPVGAKPLEIIHSPTGVIYGAINDSSKQVSFSIKYSDGYTRSIPFKYLKYTIDDPTLITFKDQGGSENTYAQYFVGNKEGQTILRLKYQDIKKDILVEVPAI